MSDDLFSPIGARPEVLPGRRPRTGAQIGMLVAGIGILLAALIGGGA